MACYSFRLHGIAALADSLEYPWVEDDGAAFEVAGRLLDRNPVCEWVEVWASERPVAARFRDQPILRPIVLN